ncbi:MAG: superoxide dismutase family protein [Chloroflexota bacterium]|nr:superoxide dismutase family protein [Chloroflexota bacterium]
MVRYSGSSPVFAVLLASRPIQPVAAQDGTPEVGAEGTPSAGPIAVTLLDTEAENEGTVTFTEVDGRVTISGTVEGLTPGEHGIHVHETGVCVIGEEMAFSSAGGHYNPTGTRHGGPSMLDATPPAAGSPTLMGTPGTTIGHAGDLGNITADNAGTAQVEISTDRFSLAELSDTDGSALVIHANPDDLQTDPAGNSGPRVVCGVIFAPMGTPTAGTPAS